MPPQFHLSSSEEKRRYETHENHVEDPDYRSFLNRLYEPLRSKLSPSSRGLDYGAGPGPALAAMAEEDGHKMSLYDLHFFPDRSVLHRSFDFIMCTETAEHFREPAKEFATFKKLISASGWIGIMTEECPVELDTFSDWYYPNDPTHICFYQNATFQWIAEEFNWTCQHVRPNVWLLQA